MTFVARHASHTHAIRVDAPPSQAFPLFTPEGERAWVEGWDPVHLHPPSGEAREGGVFVTHADGEETVWMIARYEPERFRAAYARITPGSRAARVEVRCEAEGDATRVHVTYEVTALSEEGNRFVDAFTAEHYRGFIGGWEDDIREHLRRTGRGGAG